MSSTEVTVSRSNALLVLIEPVDGLAAFEEALSGQVLEVSGGILTLDIDRDQQLPTAVIEQADAADDWVRELYGDPVADAALAAAGAPLEAGEEVPERKLAVTASALSSQATKLMTGLWLRRWWPAPVDGIPRLSEWLLDAELATLLFDLSVLFASEEPTRELLIAALPELDDDSLLPADSVVEQMVRRARKMTGMLAVGASRPQERMTEDVSSAPTSFADRIASGPVDWRTVHPRQVSADDDAVSWQLRRSPDSVGVHVEVRAQPALVSDRTGDALFFRTHLPGDALSTPLVLAQGAYIGELTLDSSVDDASLSVSVHSDRLGDSSRRAPASEEVAAVRREVTRIVQRRIDSARAAQLGSADRSGQAALVVELEAARSMTGMSAPSSGSAGQTAALIAFPRFTRAARAAASADSQLPTLRSAAAGLTVQLSSLGANTVHLTVAADPSIGKPLDVVVVSAATEGAGSLLVVALEQIGDAFLGEATFRTSGEWIDITITLPRSVAELSDEEVAAVPFGIRATSREGRGVWRRIAESLPEQHPVRDAIADGLRRGPAGQ